MVATGVADDGSLIIVDPNPVLGRTNMNDYLNGFQAGNATWRGTIVSAARVLIQAPPSNSFLLAAISQSTNGGGVSARCPVGPRRLWLGPGNPGRRSRGLHQPVTLRSSRFVYCSGAESAYQANLSAPGSYRAFVEGAGLLEGSIGYRACRIRPDGFSRLGPCLSRPKRATFTSARRPECCDLCSGNRSRRVVQPLRRRSRRFFGGHHGEVRQRSGPTYPEESVSVERSGPGGSGAGELSGHGSIRLGIGDAAGVRSVQTAPGIFVVVNETGAATGSRTVGAVINQDGTLNDLGTPARRGDVVTVYCTNLGAVQPQGNLFVTVSPVTALLNSTELPVQYAGLTPGFIGLYQVNVPIPGGTAPGANLGLSIKAGGVVSNTVNVAIQ